MPENRTIDFPWLLEYELQAAARHRRYVSLILIVGAEPNQALPVALGESLRECDVVLPFHDLMAVVMTETKRGGALTVIQRMQQDWKSRPELSFAVASYPTDGQTAMELLSTAQERLERARLLKDDGVVLGD